MAVYPINVARVSQNLRAFNLLGTMRSNQLGLFGIQNQLASGLKFITPSENATGAAGVQVLDRQMERIEQVAKNLRTANATLEAGEGAMKDAADLILEAQSLASANVGDDVSADERTAAGILVNGLIEQLTAIGNRRHLDGYLFSGDRTDVSPFLNDNGGVLFRGDEGRSEAIVELDGSQSHFTVSGMEFFDAASQGIQGNRDLDPALSLDTRIGDLRGTTGKGIRLGRISVSDGQSQADIDLSGAATVGDLLDRLNAGMPATLDATIDERGIIVSSGAGAGSVSITITDIGAGQATRDLGIFTQPGTSSVNGADLDPVLTLRTPLADVFAGAGIDLASGITLQNGAEPATISFAGATTLEDVLNLINESGVGVRASVAADGNTISVVNLKSGTDLRIEENGGTAATSLGIRSMRVDTPLSGLNGGRGVQTVAGNDIRVTTRNGAQIDIDVDGALTIQDVLDRLNSAGAGRITAALASQGNGIVITDLTSGTNQFRIERLNLSPAIDGLGLNVAATGTQIVGQDVNPQRVDSAFTALFELRDALNASSKQNITLSGERLDAVLERMQQVQGKTASQAKAMLERATRMDNTKTAATIMRSDIRDVDISEAVVKFQQMQNALQANLATASRILNLSLIDYLE